jgi:hypothetical protein
MAKPNDEEEKQALALLFASEIEIEAAKFLPQALKSFCNTVADTLFATRDATAESIADWIESGEPGRTRAELAAAIRKGEWEK